MMTTNIEENLSLEQKVFNIRLKINQGRKVNKDEVELEYKRIKDPKFEQKERYLKHLHNTGVDENAVKNNPQNHPVKIQSAQEILMQQTADAAEKEKEKLEKKEANRLTFGWQAFTTDATYRAYKKRLRKLPQQSNNVKESTDGGIEINTKDNNTETILDPLEYGKTTSTNNNVSKFALERLSKDIAERENKNKTFSKRRMALENADVDYINDKNANFNKKIKKAFDKYTVEIRQNLERGTAI
jgi:hypothetical protein